MIAIERGSSAMDRQRDFSFAYAHEHFRGGMREAFPPLLDLPEMRAALLILEQAAGQPASASDRLDAMKSLAEDEKRDAKAAARTGS